LEQLEHWHPLKSLYRTIYQVTLDTLQIKEQTLVRLTFCGESFVLYQIRKMVAFWLMLVHEIIPDWLAPLAIHSPFKFYIPPVPPHGLLLKDVQEREDTGQDLFILAPHEAEFLENFKVHTIYPEITNALHDQENDFTDFIQDLPNCAVPNSDLVELKTLGDKFLEQLTTYREAKRLAKVQKSEALADAGKETPQVYRRTPKRDYRQALPHYAPPPP